MSGDNSSPAFPVPGLQSDPDFNGISTRDYFAAKAMQSMATRNNQNPNTILPDAINAYRWADAMLKARQS
jgi:hypothetical protein